MKRVILVVVVVVVVVVVYKPARTRAGCYHSLAERDARSCPCRAFGAGEQVGDVCWDCSRVRLVLFACCWRQW